MTRKDLLLILLFAVLHAATALGCRAAGISDELLLTLLTMIMVVLLCLERKVSVTFIAVAILAVNIVGFALGKGGASLLGRWVSSPLIVNPVCTFVSTLVIGAGTAACVDGWRRKRERRSGVQEGDNFLLLLVVFVLILGVRFAILMAGANSDEARSLGLTFALDYLLTCVAVIYMARYALHSQRQAALDREHAHLAQYNYNRLKQNVNPHFLFNSLNILDCLIQDGQDEAASTYTHKLAALYRGMIRSESEATVTLGEEKGFAWLYADLLMVRFPQGLEIRDSIREEDLSRGVIPSSLQMLIENATKHNSISAARPLVIEVRSDGEMVTVSNNIIPKVVSSGDGSTGLGLKYIRQQYQDVAGKEIDVTSECGVYSVSLPLL